MSSELIEGVNAVAAVVRFALVFSWKRPPKRGMTLEELGMWDCSTWLPTETGAEKGTITSADIFAKEAGDWEAP